LILLKKNIELLYGSFLNYLWMLLESYVIMDHTFSTKKIWWDSVLMSDFVFLLFDCFLYIC